MIKVVQYIVYSKQKAKNPGFYGIFSGVRINLLPLTITELHKILITCIHLNDNIIHLFTGYEENKLAIVRIASK